MKAATAKLLRAVIRLVEDDVRELADTVVEIDEREAAHFLRLRNEVDAIRSTVIEHLAMHVDGIEHSIRARCAEHSHANLGVRCVLDNGHTGEHLGPDESRWAA